MIRIIDGGSSPGVRAPSMASTTHMATPEDDRRHAPGPGTLPLWNESFWFPFYDPKQEVGVVFRFGNHANLGYANLFLFITHRHELVHTVIDHRLPVPPIEPGRCTIHGLTIEWLEPLQRFRLRYQDGPHAFDVVWDAFSPTFTYPRPPDTSYDLVPGHIEQAGRVKGTVTIAGQTFPIDCLGHRDHSWGGERDWAKFHRWNYLSGEFGPDFWFNAVRIDLGGWEMPIGGIWDGTEVLGLQTVEIQVDTADGGARQRGCTVRLVDERGREHHIVGEEVIANCPVLYGRSWLKDAFVRYRMGERIGYGILEHGYLEQP